MALIEFFDNRARVKAALNEAIIAYLHEAGGEMRSQAIRNSRTKKAQGGGQTKNNWSYIVDEDAGICTVGNSLENAIWEEFGTGEYALPESGKPSRKGGWWIRTGYSKNNIKPSDASFYKWPKKIKDKDGKLVAVFTYGKKPSRAFQKAFNKLKNKLVKRIGTIISEAMNSDN